MKDIVLYPSERIDDLLTHDLRIIQSDEVFSFSLDAVLLARFCSTPARGRLLDLCSGKRGDPSAPVDAQQAADYRRRDPAAVSRYGEKEREAESPGGAHYIVKQDLRTYQYEVPPGSYDLVTINPPYLPKKIGMVNQNEYIAAARFEILCTMEEVIAAAARLVKSGGKVAVVHRASRLGELLSVCANIV